LDRTVVHSPGGPANQQMPSLPTLLHETTITFFY